MLSGLLKKCILRHPGRVYSVPMLSSCLRCQLNVYHGCHVTPSDYDCLRAGIVMRRRAAKFNRI